MHACWGSTLYFGNVNGKHKAVSVSDRKDPREKVDNHMMVPLIGEAWDIVQREPKINDLVFPYP